MVTAPNTVSKDPISAAINSEGVGRGVAEAASSVTTGGKATSSASAAHPLAWTG